MTNNSNKGFKVEGKFTMRDLLLLLSFLGLGGHAYIAHSADRDLQDKLLYMSQQIVAMKTELDECHNRVNNLESFMAGKYTFNVPEKDKH